MQWLHYPSQSYVNKLTNVRREASRHFRNKRKEYMIAKIEKNKTNNKIKNIRFVSVILIIVISLEIIQ